MTDSSPVVQSKGGAMSKIMVKKAVLSAGWLDVVAGRPMGLQSGFRGLSYPISRVGRASLWHHCHDQTPRRASCGLVRPSQKTGNIEKTRTATKMPAQNAVCPAAAKLASKSQAGLRR